MASDNSTSVALQHLGLVNQQFANAAAPINNFMSANASVALQREQMRIEQANRLAALQFQSNLQMQQQSAQQQAALKLSQFIHQDNNDQQLKIAELNIKAHDDRTAKDQADKIRLDPLARRVLKDKIASIPDTPEGNRQLVSEYTKAFSDPDVLENMHLDLATGLTGEIKSVLGQLSSSFDRNGPQSKRAIQMFLASPGVADLLTKKGNMSAAEIAAVAESGDASKVKGVIDRVAKDAAWFGTNENVLSQLVGAWNNAQVESGSVAGPDQLVNAEYLKTVMTKFNSAAQQLNKPESWKKLTAARGPLPSPTRVPPPASAGIGAPPPGAPTTFQPPANPFAPPTNPAAQKVGLGRIGVPSPMDRALAMAGREDLYPDRLTTRGGAFAPPQLAQDPHTELAVRQNILKNLLEAEQFKAGATQGLPFVPNYQPRYDPYTAVQDEATLEHLVRGLYGIK